MFVGPVGVRYGQVGVCGEQTQFGPRHFRIALYNIICILQSTLEATPMQRERHRRDDGLRTAFVFIVPVLTRFSSHPRINPPWLD